ncbi:hypothetical protein KCTC32516_01532 [Polaribacter huanghezhanensis]|nr:hypothetical protein KCTC32516_01532 [Polaribacter huanghezhanensis]
MQRKRILGCYLNYFRTIKIYTALSKYNPYIISCLAGENYVN